jgi:multidrug efflux pump subunit AcrB
MEKIIRFFVERHLLVNVLTAAVVVLGLLALMRTNVAGFPEATLPMYLVSASLPGAAAKDVETKISIPIEDELREVDGLESFTTIITDNRSVTTVKLNDDTPDEDILEKEREIRNAIDGINDFPADMRDDPRVFLMDPSKQPILEIAVSGEEGLLPDAARLIERAVLRIDSVGEVIRVGLPDPELRVLVDPAAAQTHGVTILDVVQAIERRNVSDTGGVLESAGDRRQVVMWGRYADPSEVGETIIRFDGDAPIRVRDVARLELGREDVGLIAGTNGRPGLSLIAVKKADADVIDTRNAIAAVLEDLTLPAGVTTTIVNDSSYEMSNRLNVIATNGMMGLALVAAIVFLFLAPSAALWVCIGVPLVILGVIAVMPQVGMTINYVSTIAFVIVLGMLVHARHRRHALKDGLANPGRRLHCARALAARELFYPARAYVDG